MKIEPIKRQSFISLANVIGLTALGYIATMYFAHILGPAVLGSYYLFLSYYGIFSLVGDGGFGGAATKRISEGNEQNEYFSAFIVLRIILLAFSVTALLLLSPYFKDFASSGLLPWLILALVAGTIASFAATGVYGTAKVGVAQISDLLNTLVRIVTQIIATFLGYAAAGLAGGFIVGLLAGFILNFFYLPLKLTKFCISHLKSLFNFSFWIFLTSSGFAIFATADTILIGYYLTNADVGVYRIAYQMTGAALFIATALCTALFPRISRWNAEDDLPHISSVLTRAFSFSLLLAVPVVIGGIILGDNMLFYLYGADFETGTQAFIILLLMQLATIFVTLQVMCLNAMDRPKSSFIATSIAALTNIILNIILIPPLGIVGAAIATLFSVVLNAVLSYGFLTRHLAVILEWKCILNITIAAFIMGGVVLAFQSVIGINSVIYLIIAIGIGAIVYFPILFRLDTNLRREFRDILLSVGLL